MAWNNHGLHAGTFCGTDTGAKIMRILNPVQHEKERFDPLRIFEKGIERLLRAPGDLPNVA